MQLGGGEEELLEFKKEKKKGKKEELVKWKAYLKKLRTQNKELTRQKYCR